ncbi:MAG: transcription termination/antitermination protein NusA, partial [Clostridia bacterium]
PELKAGLVKIESIVREAGFRTKFAVSSQDPNIDAVGACIGNKGVRVNAVVAELSGEKIDVIEFCEDPMEYIARALSPAQVLMVSINEEEKTSRVVVPDEKLSLAIGRSGQNARLAAKLTGWKIDVKPYSSLQAENEAAAEAERAEAEATENADAEATAEATTAETTENDIVINDVEMVADASPVAEN